MDVIGCDYFPPHHNKHLNKQNKVRKQRDEKRHIKNQDSAECWFEMLRATSIFTVITTIIACGWKLEVPPSEDPISLSLPLYILLAPSIITPSSFHSIHHFISSLDFRFPLSLLSHLFPSFLYSHFLPHSLPISLHLFPTLHLFSLPIQKKQNGSPKKV